MTVAYAALVPADLQGVQAAVCTTLRRQHVLAQSFHCGRGIASSRSFIAAVCSQAELSLNSYGISCCMHTQDDAAEAEWFPVVELPPLAFDHKLVGAISVDGVVAVLMQWRLISPKYCCHPLTENAVLCCRWCAQLSKNSQSMLTPLPQVVN